MAPSGASGAAITLTHVTWWSSGAEAARPVAGISLRVPPGQSVALHSEPPGDAIELLDVIAGLRRPRSGQVLVDDFAVDQLSGPDLNRYLARRGLLGTRFPLLPSLSATDNVLAVLPADQLDAAARERATHLLAITGAAHYDGPAATLSAEQRWRVLIARALLLYPRLMFAEDPTPGLDSRTATTILDLLTDVHAQYAFTLLLMVARLTTASRCQRLIRLVGGAVVDDDLIGDDPSARGRVDRIG